MATDEEELVMSDETVGDIHDLQNEKIGDRLNGQPEEEIFPDNTSPETKFWMKRFTDVMKENEELKTEVKELDEAFGATSDESDQYCADLGEAKKRIVLLETALKDTSKLLSEIVATDINNDEKRADLIKRIEELLGNKAIAHVIVLDEEARDEILRILKENTI